MYKKKEDLQLNESVIAFLIFVLICLWLSTEVIGQVVYNVSTPNDLFIPSVFTPNGDGKNDRFKIIGKEKFNRVSLMVFNRYGNVVYLNDHYKNEWDGSGLSEGTYYYILRLKNTDTLVRKSGWLLLKR